VPPHQGRQSVLVAAADVILKELPIGQSRPIPQKHGPAKVLDDLAHLAVGHFI
jgi:hypothetical protein